MKHSTRVGKALKALAASAILFTMAGCSTGKTSLSYFDDIIKSQSGTLGTVDYKITIVPDDILDISITSADPAMAQAYGIPHSYLPIQDPVTGTVIMQQSGGMKGYRVTSDGDITLPVIGKLHVAGLTTNEVTDLVMSKVINDLPDPIVTVDLRNFRVNVLGEVHRPGFVTTQHERFSVLDAIAAAGDLTQYAVRDNVLLVREKDGVKEYHHLNLNSSDLFKSPYFYLQQNDMLVVEPNNVKRSNATYNTNNAYKIQVTSAIISGCSVLASLIIALAVK